MMLFIEDINRAGRGTQLIEKIAGWPELGSNQPKVNWEEKPAAISGSQVRCKFLSCPRGFPFPASHSGSRTGLPSFASASGLEHAGKPASGIVFMNRLRSIVLRPGSLIMLSTVRSGWELL
jgi:hypothetical protein